MTVVLLLQLVAQPAPDESHIVQNLLTQLHEADRLSEDDPEGAVRLLNALLDDPRAREMEARSARIRTFREQALYCRAQNQLQLGQAQAVANELTALLHRKRAWFLSRVTGLVGTLNSPLPQAPLGAIFLFPPEAPLSRVDCLQCLYLRAEAYEELEQHDKAQADRAEATKILREMMPGQSVNLDYPPPSAPLEWLAWIGRMDPWVLGSLIVVVAFVATVPIFFLTGLRQRREAGGTWRRLFGVSLVLAALQTAPVLAALLLARWQPPLAHSSALPAVTFLAFCFGIAWHRAFLKAVKWTKGTTAPPLLEDKAVLARIAQIAGRLGIAPPVTRVVRSASSLQTNQALVVGLVAPTMVLYDGILYRLAEEERDAIIAHELAHLANHSFWYGLISGTVCTITVVVASAFYSVVMAIGLGLALLSGAVRILKRRLELDCDRRAARAIGHRRAASALSKIHADQPYHGVVEFLIGAVSTHPSRDERLAAIRRDAPDDDRPEVEWDSRVLALRRLAAWSAAGLWLSVIIACLVWGSRWPDSIWPAVPLLLMDAALVVLFWLGLRKAARRQRRLQATRSTWLMRLTWLLPPLLLGGILAAYYAGLTRSYLGSAATLAVLAGGVLIWLTLWLVAGRNRATKLNHQIVIAVRSGDYAGALALAEGSPAVVAGNTKLRYNHALLRAVLGRREEALADLERLRRDDPSFKMTSLLLVNLYTDEGEYARALEVATQLSHELPGDPIGPLAASWPLRKLGRLEEAETRAGEVLKMEPRNAQAHLTLAGVAFDRGDQAGAREHLSQAERRAPGSVNAALLAAEMALATEDGAEAAVNRAVNAVKNNPLSFADKQVGALERRLAARRQASTSLE
jgi:Zn-dependent protease with chaperone function